MASMVGMPVVSALGVRMGEVRDAWVDPVEHRVLAFVVEWEETQATHQGDVLPLVDVTELNADVLTIGDELGAGHGLDRDFPEAGEGLLLAIAQVLDLRLVDERDQVLGLVVDVLFDPQDGGVQAYEIGPEGGEAVDTELLVPHRGLEFRDGDALVCPAGCAGHLHDKPTLRLDLAILRELDLEEADGEEEVEVVRVHGAAEA
jgi:uncharacterized protein YrrD